jgi:hypothetical protein
MSVKNISKILLIALLVLAPLVLQKPLPTQAVTASDWRAGRIIDDAIFTNANDMSVSDIQAFLQSKVPVCDIHGEKSVGYYYNASTGQPKFSWISGGTWVTTTRAVFAQRYSTYYQTNISNMPFTCLKNYYEVPKTAPGPNLPASNAFGASIPSGAVSAAQMIYNASVKYSINPKVLLVKLHTESAGPLTTDDWPFQNQYLYAMGAHCPDSGPGGSANCDSNYAGFSIQMDEAASLLRWYLNSMTQSWWQYKKPYQQNSILWNVQPSGCGAGDVYIETKATAALYTYTPYQPNAAALTNMYTTGDGCSAYGNRNFWRVYSDWFGDTTRDLVQTPNQAVYLIKDGSRRLLSTPEIFISNGYRWEDIRPIGYTELLVYPEGPQFTYNTNFRNGQLITAQSEIVYLVENGTKRVFPTGVEFISQGFKFSDIVKVSQQELGYLPTGPNITYNTNFRNGQLITAQSEIVYLVENGTKRVFPNLTVFLSYSYRLQDIKVVSIYESQRIPDGAQMPLNQ